MIIEYQPEFFRWLRRIDDHVIGSKIPTMLLSHSRKFLFIHVYKTAGISVKMALRPYACSTATRWSCAILRRLGIRSIYDPHPLPAHSSAREIRDYLGQEQYDQYFTFAFVRNPWDWQVSLYKYMLREPRHHQHELAKSFSGFDDYLKWRCEQEVRFQKDYVCNESDQPIVEFIGRLENIEADFAKICERIGISVAIPHANVSSKTPYQEFYTEKTRQMVQDTFAPDIDLFDYQFDA